MLGGTGSPDVLRGGSVNVEPGLSGAASSPGYLPLLLLSTQQQGAPLALQRIISASAFGTSTRASRARHHLGMCAQVGSRVLERIRRGGQRPLNA
eukprot:5868378-Prymnesium_polylepis.2